MLLIFDGMNVLYRGYYAAPRMYHKKFPTGGIKAATNIILSAIKEHNPTHVVVVFDSHLPNFRNELYPEYKGTRDKSKKEDIEIRQQIQPLRDLLTACGIKVVRFSGYEGDDVVGSFAVRYVNVKRKMVRIMSNDKDFGQLLTRSDIQLIRQDNTIFDHKSFKSVLGVEPKRVVDFLALMSDKVDNIIGVPNCGPKTAIKWLDEYKTIERLTKNAHKIGGKIGDNLRSTIDSGVLDLNKILVTIKTDVEPVMKYDLNKLRMSSIDTESVSEICKKYKLTGLPTTIQNYLR